MPMSFVVSQPQIRLETFVLFHTDWSAVNTAVTLQSGGSNFTLTSATRIIGVTLEKRVPFDAGVLRLGHGATAASRNTLGTGDEIAATVAGTISLEAWRTSTDGTIVGGFNALTLATSRTILARIETAVPTQGEMYLTLALMDVSGRTVF